MDNICFCCGGSLPDDAEIDLCLACELDYPGEYDPNSLIDEYEAIEMAIQAQAG